MNHLERMQAQARKRLPKDESIIYCVPSDYRQTDGAEAKIPMGIMAATEKRIFYLSTGLIGFTMEEYPYENISRINHTHDANGDSLSIFALNSQTVLKWTMLGDISNLVSYAQASMMLSERAASFPEISSWQALKLSALKTTPMGIDFDYHQKKSGLRAKR